jgi:hypothetical protein
MSTLMQAVERLRGHGTLPTSGTVSVRNLHQRFQPQPHGSTRALLLRMFGGVASKLPWAIILCRFKGSPPNPTLERPIEQFYREVFTSGTGGMIEYWRDVSLGAIDITGSQVFGWIEVDVARANAGVGSKVTRGTLIDYAISAAQRDGLDPLSGFHSQIAIYTQNWSKDGAPPGADWSHPQWGQFWIDGSADGRGKVCLTPPHNGNVSAHEMGHGFGMNHDLGANVDGMFINDYSDPCCILSQNNPFVHTRWNVNFGPALCLPHLIQKEWMYSRRVYRDTGAWQANPDGITLPLSPVTEPVARANLGITLGYRSGDNAWDYYLEYVKPTDWNKGIRKSFLFIRRLAPHATYGETPAILASIEVPTTPGTKAEFVEPFGNVRFQIEWFDTHGQILKIRAKKL